VPVWLILDFFSSRFECVCKRHVKYKLKFSQDYDSTIVYID